MKVRTLAATIIAAGLVGCTTIVDGQRFSYDAAVRSKIVKGVSTKSDVRQMLGEPFKKDNDNVWIYYMKEVTVDTELERTLTVNFDDNIVSNVKYKFHEENPLKRHNPRAPAN